MHFSEDFLYYVWQFRLYDLQSLKTTSGEALKVLNTGLLNKNSGPDFNEAKVQIEDKIWVGHVEIHLKSSDWLKHNHQTDSAYENVILHVVYEDDAPIYRIDGSLLPVFELKGRIATQLIDKYADLVLSLNDFPCSNQIKDVEAFAVSSFLSRTLVERFEHKSVSVFETLNSLNGNWDETFYRFMAKNFGFKVNALPFELLAAALPQNIYAKHKNNALQIDALVFGVAGFLDDDFEEEYPLKLKAEFDFLKLKYQLKSIDVSLWKFMRMRPQNFPTIRLAQFAALIVQSNHLFSKILEIKDVIALRKLFEKLPVNSFWETHYHFKKKTGGVNTQMGKSSVDNVLLNTVALFLFAYGKHVDSHRYVERAIQLLEGLPAEKNAIIEKYALAGMKIKTAFESQGVLQLKKEYCDEKKCLNCGIGIKILKQA